MSRHHDEGPCGLCGRRVALRGVTPQGRICSACCARRQTGTCTLCGQDDARLVGHRRGGGAWCQRCYARDRAARRDDEHRAAVTAAVHAVEADLPEAVIGEAITAAGTGARGLHSLAARLRANPGLVEGPTTHPPLLDRFTRALIAAGSQTLKVIHPACGDCGRRCAVYVAAGHGFRCDRCHADLLDRRCAGCGHAGRLARRDRDGRSWCASCVNRTRAAQAGQVVTEQIIRCLGQDTDATLAATVAAVVTQVAPLLHHRRRLARVLTRERGPADAGQLPVIVARLHLALRAAGVTTIPAPVCTRCRQPVTADADLTGNRLRCKRCATGCRVCDRAYSGPVGGSCPACRGERPRPRGVCGGCGAAPRLLDEHARCRSCRDHDQHRCTRCRRPGPATHSTGRRLCLDCARSQTLDELLPPAAPTPLQPLGRAILAAEPHTTLRWLQRQNTRQLLRCLTDHPGPIGHDLLDGQPPSRAVEHLRTMLVATGALPADQHRPIARLEADLTRALAVGHEQNRRVVLAYLRWAVLPRLRRCADDGRDVTVGVANTRRALGQVQRFLDALAVDGRALAGTTQTDIDAWFTRPTAIAQQARPFLAWAQRHQHLPAALTLPHSPRPTPAAPADPEHRWAIARRLVNDDSIDAADRVAAALLVLYAQPVARIIRLTTRDVQRDDDRVTIGLGPDRLELPEPFASLTTQLPLRRRNGVADQLDTPWLFPGHHAGRALSRTAMARRMQAIGIDPRPVRLTALAQLAADIPPAMLAGLLGISPVTAARWTGLAGGNWTSYINARSDHSG